MRSLFPKHEKQLLKNGYQNIIGLDEAGRGAWAGPVVAACLKFGCQVKLIGGVNDSKLLNRQGREKMFAWLTNNFDYGIGVVSHELIDLIGIVAAVKLAMKQAIENLSAAPDYLFTDAIRFEDVFDVSQENIIKGDRKIWTIAGASIIAKVTRDKIMDYYHNLFTDYGFNQHKGYGTTRHYKMICRYGICRIHRKSYQPIKETFQK